MRKYLFVFFTFAGLVGYSQARNKLDSLLRTEKLVKEDTNGIKHLYRTSKSYRKINYDSAVFYLSKARTLAYKVQNKRFILHVYNESVGLQKIKGDLRQLLDTVQKAKQLAEEFKELSYVITFNLELGITYRKLSNYDKSIRHLLEGLKIAEQTKDSHGTYNAYNSLANTYSQAGEIKGSLLDLQRALHYYEKAYNASDKNNKAVSGMILNNKGVTYFNIGKIHNDSSALKNAIIFYQKSLQLRIEENNPSELASSYDNLAGAYQHLYEVTKTENNLDIALVNYEKAIEIAKKVNSPEVHTHITANYAACLSLIGRKRKDKKTLYKAASLLTRTVKLALQNEDVYSAMNLYENLNYCFEALNKPDSALYYLHRHIALKDTLLSQENKQVAEELAAKFESDLKDTENNNLKQQAELREEVISKKSNTIKLMIAASVIMLGLIVMVFISRQKINKSRALIKQQQIETQKQKVLIEEKQKEIVDSINYSKRLQDAAIPSLEYFRSLLPDSFVFYKPKDIVAGDFYWIHELSTPSPVTSSYHPAAPSASLLRPMELVEGGVEKVKQKQILLAAADCTGHGVPGALVSIVCLNALNRCVEEYKLTQPAQILDKAAEIIQQSFRQTENDVKDGMDIALCLFDLNNYKGYYAGANNPVWIISGTEVKEIKGDSQPVGQQHIPKPFTQHTFDLKKGDAILLATDGFADQFGGPKGKKFKYKQFSELLLSLKDKPLNDQPGILNNKFEDWKGNLEQVDDVLVIGVKV